MILFDDDLQDYLDALARFDDPILAEMEELADHIKFPIVGAQVGRVLYAVTVAMGARHVLELGSGFGYSAWWFARAVGSEGRVVLTDRSSERLDQARDFLGRAGLGDRIVCEQGDALELIENHDGPFDIVFNDVDKERYPDMLALATPRLRRGGLLICDNMLWHGQVVDPDPDDPATAGVLALTEALYDSGEYATAMLPVRDGVTVSVRL